MVFFPFCKINLGLHILSKRPDGFHSIETCFYPLPWKDILEIIPSDIFMFTSTGIPMPGEESDNLCVKAYRLLQKDFKLPPVQLYLRKIIAVGAGLGGGSSDAAVTLTALREIFSLKINEKTLFSYAAQLGSDCSFFLGTGPMVGTGRGELLNPVRVELQGKFVVLVTPDIHIRTKDAYDAVTPGNPEIPLTEILQRPLAEWKERLSNDFETSVFNKHPEIAEIKTKLYSLGATYASMSGSGSSVFGIFENPCDVQGYFPAAKFWSGRLN